MHEILIKFDLFSYIGKDLIKCSLACFRYRKYFGALSMVELVLVDKEIVCQCKLMT